MTFKEQIFLTVGLISWFLFGYAIRAVRVPNREIHYLVLDPKESRVYSMKRSHEMPSINLELKNGDRLYIDGTVSKAMVDTKP